MRKLSYGFLTNNLMIENKLSHIWQNISVFVNLFEVNPAYEALFILSGLYCIFLLNFSPEISDNHWLIEELAIHMSKNELKTNMNNLCHFYEPDTDFCQKKNLKCRILIFHLKLNCYSTFSASYSGQNNIFQENIICF